MSTRACRSSTRGRRKSKSSSKPTRRNGALLDAAELMVAGRATRIGLLREFLPDLGSADGGYVRVMSTSIRMRALALRGQMDGTGLLHLAAQTVP